MLKYTRLNTAILLLIVAGLSLTSCSKKIDPSQLQQVAVKSITNTAIFFENGKQLPLQVSGSQSRFLLVRHAEKQSTQSNDPALTGKGARRAQKLSDILTGVKISSVYSTAYNRTLNTAAPTVKSQGATLRQYAPSKLDSLAQKLIADSEGQTVLIVGHSNTTPALVNALTGNTNLPQISEQDYDDLYLVLHEGDGKTELLALKYWPDEIKSPH